MDIDLHLIAGNCEFSQWKTINDTIMGGSSEAICKMTPDGLLLQGVVIEENGGFVSCLSPFLSPSLDLSQYNGIQLDLDGGGRTLKFAIACGDTFNRFTEFISGGIRWVVEVKTNKNGTTTVTIPFDDFKPNIRAKPIPIPLRFDPTSIVQFQLLHSKFGTSGNLNSGFKAGPLKILLRSISAYF